MTEPQPRQEHSRQPAGQAIGKDRAMIDPNGEWAKVEVGFMRRAMDEAIIKALGCERQAPPLGEGHQPPKPAVGV